LGFVITVVKLIKEALGVKLPRLLSFVGMEMS